MIQAHSYEHTVYVKEQYQVQSVVGSKTFDTYQQAYDHGVSVMQQHGDVTGFKIAKTYVRATKEEAEQGIAEDLADVYDREADEYRTIPGTPSDFLAHRPPVRLMKVAEQPGLIGAQQIQTWRAGDHIVAVTINDGEIAKIELVK